MRVARRFIAGSAIKMPGVPQGRLKLARRMAANPACRPLWGRNPRNTSTFAVNLCLCAPCRDSSDIHHVLMGGSS